MYKTMNTMVKFMLKIKVLIMSNCTVPVKIKYMCTDKLNI